MYSCFCEQEQSMKVDKASHLKLDIYPRCIVVDVCLLHMQYLFSYGLAHIIMWHM